MNKKLILFDEDVSIHFAEALECVERKDGKITVMSTTKYPGLGPQASDQLIAQVIQSNDDIYYLTGDGDFKRFKLDARIFYYKNLSNKHKHWDHYKHIFGRWQIIRKAMYDRHLPTSFFLKFSTKNGRMCLRDEKGNSYP